MPHNKRNKKTFFATFLTSTGGIFLFCSLLFFIFNSSFLTTLAAPDLEMTYHGKLTDTSNVAVADGSYDFTITIYDAASNGTCLWTARGSCGTPTAKSISVTNGIFSTTLGESGDNALDLDFSANYWLDIKISTNPSMTPRRKITPTGFALNSHRLNGLTADNYIDTSATGQTKSGALTVNDDFTVNTDDFFVDTSLGYVGIGTASPEASLHVNDDTTEALIVGDGSQNSIFLGSWGAGQTDIDGLLPGSTFGSLVQGGENAHITVGIQDNDVADAFSIISGGGDYMTDSTYDTVILHAQSTGNVGIGTSSPSQRLHVLEEPTDEGKRSLYSLQDAIASANGTYYNVAVTADMKKEVQSGITDSGYAMGLDAIGELKGAGTLSYAYGLRTHAGTRSGSTGTVNNAYGMQTRVLNQGSGSITNGFGIYITDTEATNDYGIYQVGANDSNYFAGNTGFGQGADDSYQVAVRGIVNGTSGSWDYQRGVFVGVNANPNLWTQTSHAAVGIVSSILTDSSIEATDTLDQLNGINIQYGTYDGTLGAVTNAYGLRIVPYRRAGTIDNQYDLYIASPSTGGTLTNAHYSIYQESPNTTNYFAGNVGIGRDPATALDVSGTIKADGYPGIILTHDDAQMRFYGEIASEKWVMGSTGGVGDDFIIHDTENATTRLLIDDTTGDIGIGTASPGVPLHVYRDMDSTASLRIQNVNTGTSSVAELHINGQGNNLFIQNYGDGTSNANETHFLSTAASSQFIFSPANSEAMRIDSAGNVGIGTTNPNELLQVNGAINIGTTTNTNAGTIRWNGSDFQGYTGSAWASLTASGASSIWDADTDTGIQVEESTDDDIIRFDTAGTERMTIDSFGNLIPSAVETYNLGSSSYRWQDLYLGPESLHIGSSTTDEGIISYNTTSNIFGIATDATTQGDIAFNTNDLYIDTSASRVGIGTSSPDALLHVRESSGVGRIYIEGSTNSRLQFFESTTERWNIGYDASSNLFSFYDTQAGISPVKFEDGAGTDTLVVDSNSRVGIGTSNPQHNLQVGDTTDSGTNNIAIMTNDGQIGELRFADASDYNIGMIQYNHSENSLRFYSNNSERMRINSSGYVGIGITDPLYSLDVNGTAHATGFRVNSETVTDWTGANLTISGGALTVSDNWVNTTGDTMTGSIYFDVSTGDNIFSISGGGANKLRKITDQGGVSFSTDSSMLLHAGDNVDNLVSEIGIVAGTTGETLYLTADSGVRLITNRQSGTYPGNTHELAFTTSGSLTVDSSTVWHAGNDPYDTEAEIDAAVSNNGYLTSETGDIAGVTAGSGLTGGGTSGTVTLNVGAGTGITVASNSISTTLGTSIDTGEIINGTIQEIDLEATNVPTNNYILSYDSGTGGFTWVQDANSGGDITGITTNIGTCASGTCDLRSYDGSGSQLDADRLDNINSSQFLRSDATDFYAGGQLRIDNDAGIDVTTTTSINGLQVYQATANSDALMSFHIAGDYAMHFGLDGNTNDLTVGGWSMGANKYRVWHEGNDGASSTLNAGLLDDMNSAEASTASTIVARNSAGDINARLFRSEYDTTNSNIGYIMTQIDTASNNYIRPSTPAQLVAGLGLQAGGSRDIWIEKAGDTTGALTSDLNIDANTLFVDASANRVGIGTASPVALLDIATNDISTTPATAADELLLESSGDTGLSIFAGTNSNASIYFGEQSVGTGRGRIIYDTNTDDLTFYTTGSQRITIDSDGDVGIGETNPGAKLHVDNIGDTVANVNDYGMIIDHDMSGSDALTADRTHAGLYVDVDSSATGGDTNNEHRVYGLQSNVQVTGDSDLVYASHNTARTAHSSGTVSNVVGSYGLSQGDNSAGTTSNVMGVQGLAYEENAGTRTGVFGTYGKTLKQATATTATNSHTGGYGEIETDNGAAAITTGYAFRAIIDNDNTGLGASAFGTSYLFHGDYQGTIPTNAYGVYIADVVDNYFAGNIGIGTSSPRGALDVNGAVRLESGAPNGADISTNGLAFEDNGDTGLFLTNYAGVSAGDLNLYMNNQPALTIDDATRYIGIGTTIPDAELDVHGSVHVGVDQSYDFLSISPIDSNDYAYISARNTRSSPGTTKLALQTFTGGMSSVGLSVDNIGRVGIGMLDPAMPLDINGTTRITGSTNPRLYLSSTDPATSPRVIDVSSGTLRFFREGGAEGTRELAKMYANGNFEANGGITAQGAILANGNQHVEGGGIESRNTGTTPYVDWSNDSSIDFDVRIVLTGDNTLQTTGGTLNTGSDRNIKNSIENIPSALDKIMQINGVYFNWNDEEYGSTTDRQVGVIAQDVERVFPELVHDNGEYMSVSYQQLIGPTIEAIKEQNTLITTNTNNLTDLTSLSTTTEEKFESLSALLTSIDEDTPENTLRDDFILLQESANTQADLSQTIQENIDLINAEQSALASLVSTHNDTIVAINENILFTTDKDDNTVISINRITIFDELKANNIETERFSVIEEVTEENEEGEDVNASTVGIAIMPAGETELIVETVAILENDHVFVNPRAPLKQSVAAADIISEESFTIKLIEAIDEDIEIDWFIVGSK